MELAMEIISRETIKPSTPTPPHLKHLKLSLVDQLAPWMYFPLVMFYAPPSDKDFILNLKSSLSKTLSLYYPIAGRFTNDEFTVDCNDEGIPFAIARAKCRLTDFLDSPQRVSSLHHFLPVQKNMYPRYNNEDSTISRSEMIKELVQFAVQLTVFDCGGIAIGWIALHKLLDGTSTLGFLRCWASHSARPNSVVEVVPTPDFTSAPTIFPPLPNDEVPKGKLPLPMLPTCEEGACPIKPFVFSPKAIAALRGIVRSDQVPNPTRIETVCAFIWMHAMAAAKARTSSKSGSPTVINLVNVRPHTSPPLPTTSVGNILMHGISSYEGETTELHDLIVVIRKAISKAKDRQFLRSVVGEKGRERLLHCRKQVGDLTIKHTITREHRYKFSFWGKVDMDYGFGKPIWTGITDGRLMPFFKNQNALLQLPDGGIEAWLILEEQDMEIMESNPNFLAFASPRVGGQKNMSRL